MSEPIKLTLSVLPCNVCLLRLFTAPHQTLLARISPTLQPSFSPAWWCSDTWTSTTTQPRLRRLAFRWDEDLTVSSAALSCHCRVWQTNVTRYHFSLVQQPNIFKISQRYHRPPHPLAAPISDESPLKAELLWVTTFMGLRKPQLTLDCTSLTGP